MEVCLFQACIGKGAAHVVAAARHAHCTALSPTLQLLQLTCSSCLSAVGLISQGPTPPSCDLGSPRWVPRCALSVCLHTLLEHLWGLERHLVSSDPWSGHLVNTRPRHILCCCVREAKGIDCLFVCHVHHPAGHSGDILPEHRPVCHPKQGAAASDVQSGRECLNGSCGASVPFRHPFKHVVL